MNTGRTVFSQIMDLLPHWDFHNCVKRYQGNRKTQTFSCMDQFLCMAFAQLTYRESLRDIEVCLRGSQPKLYHMGIRSRIAAPTQRRPAKSAYGSSESGPSGTVFQVVGRKIRVFWETDDFKHNGSLLCKSAVSNPFIGQIAVFC